MLEVIQTIHSDPLVLTLSQYSLVIAGTISIGHLSTKALASAALGSMTAGVTGFSVLQGVISSLDTLLPSAWTSSNPTLVGIWCQRMCKCPRAYPCNQSPANNVFISGVVIFSLLFVSNMYKSFIRTEPDRDCQAHKCCMDLVRVHFTGSQTRSRSRTLCRHLFEMAAPGATCLRI